MAQLIKQRKLEQQKRAEDSKLWQVKMEGHWHNSCLELTTFMKNTIDNQYDRTKYIVPPKFSYYSDDDFYNGELFSTKCPDFKAYVDSINNAPINQIQIKTKSDKVSYISTTVDLDKELVTYTLS